MHYTKWTVLALLGLVSAIPTPNDRGNGNGDTTTTSCSNSQSTVCCDKSGKNCEVKDSCSNDAMILCGNTLSLPDVLGRDLAKMLRRNNGGGKNDGDTTTTSCSNGQSTMCCNKSGKDCSVSSSCANDATIICGNVLDLSGLLGKRNDGGNGGGDDTTTTCSNSQSTMCCDKSKKNCEVSNSCSNDAVIFCGNTISIPVTTDLGTILRRTGGNGNNNNGDTTTTKCSGNQSTMCCDNSGKNCSVKDSCNNNQLIICGNSVTVPINVDAGDATCLLSGC